MLFRTIAVMALLVASTVAHAQGRIAVVDLEQAILQTDYAQQRLREFEAGDAFAEDKACLLYTSPSPRDVEESRMPSSA